MDASWRPCGSTGRAGTGKSTLLSHLCETTRKQLVVLAPTSRSVQGPDPARAGGRGAVFARIGKHVIAGIIQGCLAVSENDPFLRQGSALGSVHGKRVRAAGETATKGLLVVWNGACLQEGAR